MLHSTSCNNDLIRIAIIGTINRDTIKLPDGTVKEGWGGILYNIITLSRLVGKNVEIYPVCNIGKDCYSDIKAILKDLPRVRCDHIQKVPEKNNHCFLTYLDDKNKKEVLKGGIRPLKYGDVKPLANSDIVLVNYISGRDIYLKSLQKFRRHHTGQIFVDIHSLTLGKKEDGSRFPRTPPNWPALINISEYIQMNRLELSILIGHRGIGGKTERNIISSLQDLYKILRQKEIDTAGKVFIITDGAKGCYLSFFKRNGPETQFIPSVEEIRRGDTTGCGDCFSAGFIAGLIKRKDPFDCAKLGNTAGLSRIHDHAWRYAITENINNMI